MIIVQIVRTWIGCFKNLAGVGEDRHLQSFRPFLENPMMAAFIRFARIPPGGILIFFWVPIARCGCLPGP
jgi:hypothetical protein